MNIVVADGKGGTSTANASQGQFKVLQKRQAGKLISEFDLLGGKASVCKAGASRSAAAAAGQPKSIRRLWVDGKGNFRTKGRFSAATVRGTKWLTDDRCDGTVTKVTTGAVSVLDLVLNKSVVVKAGKQYVARPKKRQR